MHVGWRCSGIWKALLSTFAIPNMVLLFNRLVRWDFPTLGWYLSSAYHKLNWVLRVFFLGEFFIFDNFLGEQICELTSLKTHVFQLKIGKCGKHVKSIDTKLVSINFTVHLMLRYVSMMHFRNPQISSGVGGVSNCPQLSQFQLIFWWLVFIILRILLGEELGKT